MDDYDPLSQLALLAPKAVDLNHMPAAWARLTPQDIAAKLAKCSTGASLLGRIKFAGQNEFRRSLTYIVVPKVAMTFVKAFPDNHTASNIALFSFIEEGIREVVDPRICGPCRGHGSFPDMDPDGRPTGKLFDCQFCGGTGHHRHSEFSRAKALGFHPEQWRRASKRRVSYSQFYADILTVLYSFDRELREVFV